MQSFGRGMIVRNCHDKLCADNVNKGNPDSSTFLAIHGCLQSDFWSRTTLAGLACIRAYQTTQNNGSLKVRGLQ